MSQPPVDAQGGPGGVSTATLMEPNGDALRPLELSKDPQSDSVEPPLSSPTPSLTLEAAAPPSSDTNHQAENAKDSWLHRKGRSIRKSWPKSSRIALRMYRFFRGPSPPIRLLALTPWLERTYTVRGHSLTLQLESTLIKYTRPLQRAPLFWAFIIGYIISFAFLARANYFLTPADSFIGCTSIYWLGLDGCGLDGANCEPFSNSTLEFRCPSQCKSVKLENIRTVGVEEPVFVPLVVGGGDEQNTYRSDSFICAAAIHAGMIPDSRGGCATISLVGSFTNYLSSTANGITSTPFPSIFPSSFRITPSTTLSHCSDLRKEALIFDILATTFIFVVLRPRPLFLFWTLVCAGYWHVVLFSDPAKVPPPLSTAFGTFLPCLFICYALWRVAWRFTMPALERMPIERVIWYLPAFWAGVSFNDLVADIPVDRLLPSDIAQEPGALTAVIVISLAILVLVLIQANSVRRTGWLLTYLGWYGLTIIILLILAMIPTLQFRFHHYFAGLFIMPAVGFANRPSAVYQAFLLGMFLNGAGRWGFDSILQTIDELQRDAPLGSTLPTFFTNSTNFDATNTTISWTLPTGSAINDGWDGFSLLVDDVERYVGSGLNYSIAALDKSVMHFFRLAFQKQGTSGDYTKAAILWSNGTWSNPAPGPS